MRDLRGVMGREKAEIGVLLTLDEPTKAMRTEAASAGFYKSPWGTHPKLQIVTVGELLDGTRLDIPPVRQTSVTYKRAPKAEPKVAEHRSLDFGGPQTEEPLKHLQEHEPKHGPKAKRRLGRKPKT